MYYILVPMLALSLIAGAITLFVGFRDLIQRLSNISWMERSQGMITDIHRKYGRATPSGSGYGRSQVRNFPVVSFTSISGTIVSFRSEIGDIGKTRYQIGQELPVLYDPAGRISPLINTWSGLWLAPLAMIVGGLLWIGFVVFLIKLYFF